MPPPTLAFHSPMGSKRLIYWDGYIGPCLVCKLYNSENVQMHAGSPSVGNYFKECDAGSRWEAQTGQSSFSCALEGPEVLLGK